MNTFNPVASRKHGRARTPWRTPLAVASMLLAGGANAALTLDSVMHANPARPGETIQLDLTVTNTDPFARSGVTVTMDYPAGLNPLSEAEFDGDCVSTACESGETITWLLGSIAGGGHVTVVVPATIANATASGAVVGFAPSAGDDFGGAASDSASVTVDSVTRLDLAMSENADPATPGDALTYKITFGHRADAGTVTQSTIEFSIPSGTTFMSASDGGSSNGSVVSWPLGFLLPGDSGIREVTVAVDGGLPTPSVIGASAQLINVASPAETATASTDTVIAASSPLSLVIESNTNPAREGEHVNFKAVITNNDPFTRFGVTLTAQQPQDTFQLFETEFDGDCTSSACEINERITWTLGDLAAGQSISVDLPDRITNTATDGVLVNLFMVATDTLGAQVKQADTLRIQDDVLYDISLSEDADPVAAGANLTYRVHFGYRADAASVSNSTLRFELPEGTSFVSASNLGSESSGIVTWALGVLSPGDGGIRDVTVALDGGLPSSSTLDTWAEIQSVTAPFESARAEAATSIAVTSPLALTFETNTQAARAGELTHVQMIVTNNDPITRFGVVLSARTPEEINQLFETVFEGDCTSSACEANERMTFLIGDLPAGESRTVDIPAVIPSTIVDGTLVNYYATARDDTGIETGANDTLRLQGDTLYDVSVTENSDPASAGDTLQYQVTFGYREDAASTNNSRLRLALPDNVTFVSASDGGFNSMNNEVTWALGNLGPGDGGQRTVEIVIDSGLADATVLEAEAIVESIASPLEAARSRAATVVAADRPLSISIEANPKPGRASETTNIQAVITNGDPFPRFGVTVEGRFPQNVNQLFDSLFNGDCPSSACEAGETVTWTVGEIPAGGSATLQLPVTLAPANIDGLLVNFYLQASDDQGFETRDVDTIRINSDNPYEVALDEDTDPAKVGDTVNFRATFGYRSDAAMVRNSEMTLVVPAGMTPVSASNSGVIDGNVVTWPLGFLSPGDGGAREVTATVNGDVVAASILQARVHVFSVADPIEGARAETLTTVALDQPLSLTITSSPNPAQQADDLLVQLAVTNNDVFPRFGVTLVSRHPQGVNQLFDSGFGGDCPSSACEVGELVTWLIGEIGAGQTVTVDYPPVVALSVLDGELIDFYAAASDDAGAAVGAVDIVRIGDPEPVDSDSDGVLDSDDNCRFVANADQRDTNGDDIGNACDADLTGDCSVNFGDLALLKQSFFPAFSEDADFNGDGSVNFGDLALMKATFFNGTNPGPGVGLPGNACDN